MLDSSGPTGVVNVDEGSGGTAGMRKGGRAAGEAVCL